MVQKCDLTNGELKRYKKMYPELDDNSFVLGYVAGANDVIKKVVKMKAGVK